MTTDTRLWTPIDYAADGKQCDCLRLPYSTDISAYGFIPIPLICIRNGEGPTALLIAGTHGDEYEGQVALLNLARQIAPNEVVGRIILLPALNLPAVEAGRRVSPLDDGNLNRLFPGDPCGSPTQMLAHYISDVLIPMSDLVVDLHSGGRSLSYLPSALVRPGKSASERDRHIQLLRLFGAPVGFISAGIGGGGATTLAAAAEARNIPALTTELGGAGTLSPQGVALATAGTTRLLKHLGVLPRIAVEEAEEPRLMTVDGRDAYVYASSTGIFEPLASVGEEVVAGQPAGRVHPVGWPLHPAETIAFTSSGIVACQRVPSLTRPGDCLFKLMVDLPAHATSSASRIAVGGAGHRLGRSPVRIA